MTVYVDQLVTYHQKAKSGGRYFDSGKQSCHMMADTREELDAMADQIGLRRSWIQYPDNSLLMHYDLTPPKRVSAVKHGAIEVDAKELAKKRIAAKKVQHDPMV